MSRVIKGISLEFEFGPGDLHMLLLRLDRKNVNDLKKKERRKERMSAIQFQQLCQTLKISFSACCHQPLPFSPGRHRTAWTDACER